MNEITTFALLSELRHRMDRYLYDDEYDTDLDTMLTDMLTTDTMYLYFEIEEYILKYKELIEMRRQG